MASVSRGHYFAAEPIWKPPLKSRLERSDRLLRWQLGLAGEVVRSYDELRNRRRAAWRHISCFDERERRGKTALRWLEQERQIPQR